jgi:hypothetical protein
VRIPHHSCCCRARGGSKVCMFSHFFRDGLREKRRKNRHTVRIGRNPHHSSCCRARGSSKVCVFVCVSLYTNMYIYTHTHSTLFMFIQTFVKTTYIYIQNPSGGDTAADRGAARIQVPYWGRPVGARQRAAGDRRHRETPGGEACRERRTRG